MRSTRYAGPCCAWAETRPARRQLLRRRRTHQRGHWIQFRLWGKSAGAVARGVKQPEVAVADACRASRAAYRIVEHLCWQQQVGSHSCGSPQPAIHPPRRTDVAKFEQEIGQRRRITLDHCKPVPPGSSRATKSASALSMFRLVGRQRASGVEPGLTDVGVGHAAGLLVDHEFLVARLYPSIRLRSAWSSKEEGWRQSRNRDGRRYSPLPAGARRFDKNSVPVPRPARH